MENEYKYTQVYDPVKKESINSKDALDKITNNEVDRDYYTCPSCKDNIATLIAVSEKYLRLKKGCKHKEGCLYEIDKKSEVRNYAVSVRNFYDQPINKKSVMRDLYNKLFNLQSHSISISNSNTQNVDFHNFNHENQHKQSIHKINKPHELKINLQNIINIKDFVDRGELHRDNNSIPFALYGSLTIHKSRKYINGLYKNYDFYDEKNDYLFQVGVQTDYHKHLAETFDRYLNTKVKVIGIFQFSQVKGYLHAYLKEDL